MPCRNEGPLKSKFPVKMKSYFVWFTCAINFVTICSIIVQLCIDHGGMAMPLDEALKDNTRSENFFHDGTDIIEENLLVSGEIDLDSSKDYMFDDDSYSRADTEIGVWEGGSLDMSCQLQDGSRWSKCEWKHGDNSLSFTREGPYGNNGNEITNIGYPTNGAVEIVAGIRECSLHISNVSERENHDGRWTCFLSKSNNRGDNLWKENTNYFVNFFTPAKMEISILTSDLDSKFSKDKYKSMFVMEKQSQIQCEGFGGYPMISNISASIKERNSKCSGSDESTDCFSIVEALEAFEITHHPVNNRVIFSVRYTPSLQDIKRNRILVCSSSQMLDNHQQNSDLENVFEESLAFELKGNIIHRPLPFEDSKWNGSAFVITEEDVHPPIFDEEAKKQSFVAMKIYSNTDPALHNVSLVARPHGDATSSNEVKITSTYLNVPSNPGVIVVPRPAEELYNLSEKYDLFLDAYNPVGKSRLPIKVMPKRFINDQQIILWIILPTGLIIVLIALSVLFFKAYRNNWWCFDTYPGCKDCEHYTQGLITTEYDTNSNENTVQSIKIYRTPVPPPPSFESKTTDSSERNESELFDDENNMYEEIKEKKLKETSPNNNDGYINMKPQFFHPGAPLSPMKETARLVLGNDDQHFKGPCTAINSSVDKSFVNNFPPCIADADGYLISNSIKNLDISSTKESEATEGTQQENLYDHLEFNCPVKKLEPHYHSSKTLKSLASMDMEIEL